MIQQHLNKFQQPNIQLNTYNKQINLIKQNEQDINQSLLEKTQELTLNSPALNSVNTNNPSSILSNKQKFFDETLTIEQIKQFKFFKIGAPSNPQSLEVSPIQQALQNNEQFLQDDDFVLDNKQQQKTQEQTCWNTEKCANSDDEDNEILESSELDEIIQLQNNKNPTKRLSKSENLRPQNSPDNNLQFEPLDPVKSVQELKFLENISKTGQNKDYKKEKTLLFQQIESASPNIVPTQDPSTFFSSQGNNINSIKLSNIVLDFPIICQQQNCDFKTFEFNNFRIHQKAHKHLPHQSFKCEKCGFTCKKISYLDQHIKINHTKKDYSCDLCQKGNLSQLGLYQHKREVHSTQAFKCNICTDKVFKTKGSFNWHMRYVHSQGYFKCSKCKYSTVSKVQIQNHNMNHHQYFTCNFCDFTTNIRKKLREHCFSHHKSEIEGIKDIDTYLFKEYDTNSTQQKQDIQKEESETGSLINKKQIKIQNKIIDKIQSFTCNSNSNSTQLKQSSTFKQQQQQQQQIPFIPINYSQPPLNLNNTNSDPLVKTFKPINFNNTLPINNNFFPPITSTDEILNINNNNKLNPMNTQENIQYQQQINFLQKQLMESKQKQLYIQQQNQELLQQFQNQQNFILEKSKSAFQPQLNTYQRDYDILKKTKIEFNSNTQN